MKFKLWDEAAWNAQVDAALNDATLGELTPTAGLGALTLYNPFQNQNP